MTKKSGPPTKLKVPKLVDCSVCNGRGKYKGMFYEMPCDHCDANGSLNAETGNAISKETMVFALREENRRLQNVLAYSKQLCTCETKEKGHWDTFKSIFGGKQRLD